MKDITHGTTPETPSDTITLLRTSIDPDTDARRRATKTWRRNEAGGVERLDYDRCKTWDVGVGQVDDASGLFALLAELESVPSVCAVRGALRDGQPKTGRRAKERFDAAARCWMALDIDSVAADRAYAWSDPAECMAAAEYLRSLLPAEVQAATCFVSWTSKHGFVDGLRARVWVWLSRPTSDAELKAWVGSWPVSVDLSLFDPIQIHYTAAPLFEGVEDPVALRHVILPGDPCVKVPSAIDTSRIAHGAKITQAGSYFEMRLGTGGTVRQASPETRFRDGACAGRSVAQVAAEIGTGSMSVCCPHSPRAHSTDTSGGTSASLHAQDGRPTFLRCFACDDGAGTVGIRYVYRARSSGDTPDDEICRATEIAVHGVELLEHERQWVESAEHRARLDLERQREREQEEGAREKRRRQLEPLEEKVAKRLAELEALDPLLVEISLEVKGLAKGWAPQVRQRYRELGIESTGPCGFTQGLTDAKTGSMATVSRPCGSYSCLACGPYRVAVRTAATAIGAVGRDGFVEGRSLAFATNVWRYEIAEKAFAGWLRRWRRESNVRLPANLNYPLSGKSDIREGAVREMGFHPVDGDQLPTYVAIYCPPKRTFVVFSNVELTGSRKGGGGAPVATLTSPDEIKEALLATTLDSISVDSSEVLPEVVCRVSSSQTLSLDPEGILRLASAHSWVLEAHAVLSPAKAKKALKEQGVAILRESHSTEGIPTACVTEPIVDSKRREALWASIAVELPRTRAVFDDPELADLEWLAA